MIKHNASENMVTMLEYSEREGISLAQIMTMAGKAKQKTNPKPFHNHAVVINSRNELFLVPPKLIGAFE